MTKFDTPERCARAMKPGNASDRLAEQIYGADWYYWHEGGCWPDGSTDYDRGFERFVLPFLPEGADLDEYQYQAHPENAI